MALLNYLILTVLGQNARLQTIALEDFGSGGNPTYVDNDSCTRLGSTNLTCPIKSLVADPVTGVLVESVNFGLCLCGSAVAVIYSLSDETSIIHSCQQCPFVVKLGQLQIYHNVRVFVNDSGNTDTTIVRLSVSVY